MVQAWGPKQASNICFSSLSLAYWPLKQGHTTRDAHVVPSAVSTLAREQPLTEEGRQRYNQLVREGHFEDDLVRLQVSNLFLCKVPALPRRRQQQIQVNQIIILHPSS